MRATRRMLLAVLIAAATGPGTELFANCQDGNVYPISQCGEQAWFAPPPVQVGPISAAWWQLGYGHRERSASDPGMSAADGSGYQRPDGCIGNDSGALDPSLIDLVDAAFIGGPSGALCFGPGANWINTGSDGCADNAKRGACTGACPYAAYNGYDDNLLNPFWGTAYGPGYFSSAYQLDHPMGVLLTEGTGRYFAAAFFATRDRHGDPNDAMVGDFDLGAIVNGDPNPLAPGKNNVIPWQVIPQPFISAVGIPPGPPTSPRMVSVQIMPPRIIHDGSIRPSGAPSILLGDATGVGVLDQAGGDPASLVHYVFENAPAMPTGDCGTFAPVYEMPFGQLTATFIVPADTCIRMMTHFGRRPLTQDCTLRNSTTARVGDTGYFVTSREIVLGEGLASDSITITAARRNRNQTVTLRFATASELNVMQLSVFGLDARGRERLLTTLQPKQGTTGLGDTYEATLTKAQLRGARTVFIVAQPSGTRSNAMPL